MIENCRLIEDRVMHQDTRLELFMRASSHERAHTKLGEYWKEDVGYIYINFLASAFFCLTWKDIEEAKGSLSSQFIGQVSPLKLKRFNMRADRSIFSGLSGFRVWTLNHFQARAIKEAKLGMIMLQDLGCDMFGVLQGDDSVKWSLWLMNDRGNFEPKSREACVYDVSTCT